MTWLWELFQSKIESILGKYLVTAGVRVCFDDILVFHRAREEHVMLLENIFEKMKEDRCLSNPG